MNSIFVCFTYRRFTYEFDFWSLSTRNLLRWTDFISRYPRKTMRSVIYKQILESCIIVPAALSEAGLQKDRNADDKGGKKERQKCWNRRVDECHPSELIGIWINSPALVVLACREKKRKRERETFESIKREIWLSRVDSNRQIRTPRFVWKQYKYTREINFRHANTSLKAKCMPEKKILIQRINILIWNVYLSLTFFDSKTKIMIYEIIFVRSKRNKNRTRHHRNLASWIYNLIINIFRISTFRK